jgi:hypothetical protein
VQGQDTGKTTAEGVGKQRKQDQGGRRYPPRVAAHMDLPAPQKTDDLPEKYDQHGVSFRQYSPLLRKKQRPYHGCNKEITL